MQELFALSERNVLAENPENNQGRCLREPPVRQPWAADNEQVLGQLDADLEKGLDGSVVRARRGQYGHNRLKAARSRSALAIFVDQLKNLIVGLLALAAGLAFLFGQWLEGISILVAIGINILIGFFTELKAVRSMEALREMSRVTAKVRRDGEVKEIPAEQLVPGDVVVFEGGDLVPADIRLAEAAQLEADESALTGESVPVPKTTEALAADTELADRTNMLFKGTSLTRGSGEGVVTATGMDTELGHISELAETAEEEVTPLERRLNRLGTRLIWVTLGIAALLVVGGLVAGKDLLLVVETAIALAVAAVPEGLPIVATIALARGMWRMAKRNAVMNRLSAVETLGSINTVCTDKTGTLTENRMTAVAFAGLHDDHETVTRIQMDHADGKITLKAEHADIEPADHPVFNEAVEIGVLCNNAHLQEDASDQGAAVGDPLEVALLELGQGLGIERTSLLESLPEAREVAFDPDIKMMATFHEAQEGFRIAVKGAPESVIEYATKIRVADGHEVDITDELRERLSELNQNMAGEGLRMLGLASNTADSVDDDPYAHLVFVGFMGLLDPPREGVGNSIEALHAAGIRVVMVTGDHPGTALNVGKALNLTDGDEVARGSEIRDPETMEEEERARLFSASIFSRVTPEQKLNLVKLFQSEGSIVAMTGDGVNDAPALKKADAGVAMGMRGTQVAREAAHVVLKDDAFPTIVAAVEQGRAIFDNIRKFILFLLSGNVGEIMIVAFALVVGWPLPLLPLQILYLNMLGDVFPALALGMGKGDPSVMDRPPRDPEESILTQSHWMEIVMYGLLIAATVLTAFGLAWLHMGMEIRGAVTLSFLTLSFARLWHVFNMRDWGSHLWRNDVVRNQFVWGALALCTALLLLAVYVPTLRMVLTLTVPGLKEWGLIIGMSIVPALILQPLKSFINTRKGASGQESDRKR